MSDDTHTAALPWDTHQYRQSNHLISFVNPQLISLYSCLNRTTVYTKFYGVPFISQIAIAILGILVGVWFTTSNNILYNFYIMPLVGAVSYLALKKKSLFVPLGIITTVELMQILKTIPFLSYNFGKAINQIGTLLISNIYFGIIYAILSLIGILIAFLFEFTFRRDKK